MSKFGVKEPEKILGSRSVPRIFFKFNMEGCPDFIRLGLTTNDEEYVKVMYNLIKTTSGLLASKRDKMILKYPEKSAQMLRIITDECEFFIVQLFREVLGIETNPKTADGNATVKLMCHLEIGDTEQIISFTNFHMDEISRIGRVYRAICEKKGEDIAFVGPKDSESSHDNECNRFVDIMRQSALRIVEKTHAIYRS